MLSFDIAEVNSIRFYLEHSIVRVSIDKSLLSKY